MVTIVNVHNGFSNDRGSVDYEFPFYTVPAIDCCTVVKSGHKQQLPVLALSEMRQLVFALREPFIITLKMSQ